MLDDEDGNSPLVEAAAPPSPPPAFLICGSSKSASCAAPIHPPLRSLNKRKGISLNFIWVG